MPLHKNDRAPRNLLLITVDQMRGDCLSCLDHPFARTPNLDRLAQQGVVFTQHYSAALPCGPARASLHTGSGCDVHGVWRNGQWLTPEACNTNWAAQLRRRGYDPQLFGFTHTAHAGDAERGFEGILPGLALQADFRNDCLDWCAWLSRRHRLALRPEQLLQAAPPDAFAIGNLHWGRSHAPAGASDADYLVDALVDSLQAAQRDPFVVHLSTFAPHNPYLVPYPLPQSNAAAARGVTDTARVKPPPQTDHPYLKWVADSNAVVRIAPKTEIRNMQRHYWRGIELVDQALGRLFEHLRTTDRWRNTLIVFTSDHGDQLGDRAVLGKVGALRESHHVPLIVYDPSPALDPLRGAMVQKLTSSLDLAPLLIGFDGNSASDGDSNAGNVLCAMIYGREDGLHAAVPLYYDFAEEHDRGDAAARLTGCMTDRFIYAEFANGWPALLLDEADTGSVLGLRNRAADADMQSVVASMARQCNARRALAEH